MKRLEIQTYVSPDGRTRSLEDEWRLNEACKLALDGPVGELVENYIKSISTLRALSPPFDAMQLAHLEGARWLASVILNRAAMGRAGIPKLEKKT